MEAKTSRRRLAYSAPTLTTVGSLKTLKASVPEPQSTAGRWLEQLVLPDSIHVVEQPAEEPTKH